MTSFYPSTTLVVVDPSVSNYESLVNTVKSGTEVLVLDAARDGVEQISQALTDRQQQIQSLHILSHGNAGQLQLGNSCLSLETLEGYAKQLQTWTRAIATRADILLYGCRVAAGAVGRQFVQQLSALTGANIAASTNLTGSAALGGDWLLEFRTGEVKSELAFAASAMAVYPYTLAVFLDETFTDTSVADPVWVFGVDDPTNPNKVNPFLTARPGDQGTQAGGFPGNVATPIPPFPPVDATGSGVLRLTNPSLDQAAYALYNRAFPSTAGLRITFDFYSYGGTGADGISFFLIDANQTPSVAGAFGGSLGYAQRTTPGTVPGLQGGYVGIGFDEFGNFSNATEGRVGGINNGNLTPDAIAIRGSQANNYAYLTGTQTLPFSIDVPTATPQTRELARRSVEITMTTGGFMSVRIDANQDGDFDDAGETPPELQNFNVEAANGAMPDLFTLGFAASTGSSTNAHEIRNLLVETLTTPPETTDSIVPVAQSGTVNVTGMSAIPGEPTSSITQFRIIDLPPGDQGTLFFGDPVTGGGTAVTAGQTFTPDQINQIYFRATPNFTGGSFTYTAIDSLNAEDPTPATVSLVLPPPVGNTPPNADNFYVAITSPNPIDLPDFPVSDVDPGDSVALITIVSVPDPTQGQLFFGDPSIRAEEVQPGATFTPQEASQIFFAPAAGFTGGSFTYRATDSRGEDSSNATVTLVNGPINNQPPTADNITVDINPGATQDLPNLPTSDPDGTITSITIQTIPPAGQGTLFLNDPLTNAKTPVTAGQVLTPAQADQLYFESSPNFTGGSFGFFATDNLGATSSVALVNLQQLGDVLPEPPIGPEAGCRTGVRRKGKRGRNNNMEGTPDRDILIGQSKNDRLRGKGCSDQLEGKAGRDTLFGGQFGDTLMGGLNDDTVNGNEDDDMLNAGMGNDRANGGAGNDRIYARKGKDRVDGKWGNDRIFGEKGDDKLKGGANQDHLEGRQNNDVVEGGNGDDVIYGNLGNDKLYGNQLLDLCYGGRGNDQLKGQGGRDTLWGQRNNDVMYGGAQDDLIYGNGNRDKITGGGGKDTLDGGLGGDVFYYRNKNHGGDVIKSFQVKLDRINLKSVLNKAEYSRSNKFSYIKEVQVGSDTQIRLDLNGNAAGGFQTYITLTGINANSLTPKNYVV